MQDDPIVEEIRNIRRIHAAKYDNDLERIYVAIKEGEAKYCERLVNRELIRPASIQKQVFSHS
jgi:hypothetical protein